jgi:hypothetical protein
MKNILLLLVMACVAACAPSKPQVNQIENAGSVLTSSSAITMPKASPDQLLADVAFLASDKLQGRDTGTDGILEAAGYLRKRLEDIGVKPYEGAYLDAFEAGEVIGYNVVGVFPGSDGKLKNEVVVIGAHYDHIGIVNAVANDTIANGANDNATGTATVLAIAEILKKIDFNKRTVVIALFSAEEKGLLGSKHLAARMKAENKNVVAMVNYEMTGVPMVKQPFLTYLTGYDTSNMGNVFNQAYSKQVVTGKLDQAAKFNLYQRSDNYPFAQEFGIPAQTFSTFDFTNFDYYHKPGDETQYVDAKHMAAVVDATMPGLVNIINDNVLKAKN